MENLPVTPCSAIRAQKSTAESGLVARAETFDFVSRDSRGCTEWADSTVKPLRVSLVEPVAYLCDSYRKVGRIIIPVL
jgi:hypothetical protein